MNIKQMIMFPKLNANVVITVFMSYQSEKEYIHTIASTFIMPKSLSFTSVVTCKAVNVTDATKTPDKISYDYNDDVTYQCNTGFEHTEGVLARTCTAIDALSGTGSVCTCR